MQEEIGVHLDECCCEADSLMSNYANACFEVCKPDPTFVSDDVTWDNDNQICKVASRNVCEYFKPSDTALLNPIAALGTTTQDDEDPADLDRCCIQFNDA